MTDFRTVVVGMTAVFVGSSALMGCSAATDDPATSQDTGGSALKTARIYVVAPMSGEGAGLGLGVRNSVQLAVKQALQRQDVPGWNLEVVPLDDASERAGAKTAAEKAAADEQTVAVIGSIYSGLTSEMQPILGKAGIAHVAPSATSPNLTKGEKFATAPKRPYDNFFRVIAPDDAHGPTVAKYMRANGIQRVAVVHDNDDYGKGLAEAFTKAFTAAKGKIVATGTVHTTGEPSFPGLVNTLVKAKPQAVFFGGQDPQGGPLSGQFKEAGMHVPLAGGDALTTDLYIPKAGPLSSGDISTSAGAPVETVAAGKKYLADYSAADFTETATGYGPLAYDATNAVLQALSQTLPSATTPKDARQSTAQALAKVSFEGTSGKVAFDEFGDITPRVVTVNVLKSGAWKPAKTYTLD
ncbi:branched-chain amino acid ABC transporter substrate-binding protein [Gephyromycinifex aptenodytis]|uniref:branched-chain amino acid ABC transporter substrate-binding protein n=1 Tax=Gephyromycinifex aptenodytis TaxID=2716227 RepID=UPI00144851E0|nr:branched-chain amino acid ABC transporter substrate-binding protein [Gephyromycinifex aptenodytis]